MYTLRLPFPLADFLCTVPPAGWGIALMHPQPKGMPKGDGWVNVEVQPPRAYATQADLYRALRAACDARPFAYTPAFRGFLALAPR